MDRVAIAQLSPLKIRQTATATPMSAKAAPGFTPSAVGQPVIAARVRGIWYVLMAA